MTLLGANGAGKSTTLRSINGLQRPRQGSIHFEGRDITQTSAHEIVKRGIAQSPEGRRLFPRMSVTENLEMGAFQRTDKSGIKEDMERVFELFLCQGAQGSRGGPSPKFVGDDETGGVWMSWWVPSPSDVDAVHELAVELGYEVSMPPKDEPWGVREFHLRHRTDTPSG